MPAPGSVDLVLSTEGQRPEAVAECIRQVLPDELIAPQALQTWIQVALTRKSPDVLGLVRASVGA